MDVQAQEPRASCWCNRSPKIGLPSPEPPSCTFEKKKDVFSSTLCASHVSSYLYVCFAQYNVEKIAGTAPWENVLAKAGHYGLYAFMTIMPATGIAMGYYGGKGLPFFYTTIPGAAKANGNIAKQVRFQASNYLVAS